MVKHEDRAVNFWLRSAGLEPSGIIRYRGMYRLTAVPNPASKSGGQVYEEEFIKPGHEKWGHHRQNEVRQFLEGPHAAGLGEYIVMAVEPLRVLNDDGYLDTDYSRASSITVNGYDIEGARWYPAIWWMGSDNQAYFVMSRSRLSARAAGLDISVSKNEDMFKESKYLRRVLAHHEGVEFGTVLTENKAGNEMMVNLCGNIHRVQFRDFTSSEFGPLDDGAHPITYTAARRIIGPSCQVGDGFQITILTPRGLAKGHMIVVPDTTLPSGISMVLIGMKSLLKSTGNLFSFGVLGTLHAFEDVWTDAQSWQTLNLHPFAFEWAEKMYHEFQLAIQDEDQVRLMLASALKKETVKNPDTGELEPISYLNEPWRLAKMLRAEKWYDLGLEVTKIPGALRSVNRLFKDLILQMTGDDKKRRIRIKIPKNVAWARYIIVDPTAYDPETGMIDPSRGVLDHGEAYMSGKVGPCYMYRRPIAHKDEKYRLTLKDEPRLRLYAGSPFIIVSAKDIAWVLSILGGGDQDDCVVVLFGPKVVAHLDRLAAYRDNGEAFSLSKAKKPANMFTQGAVRYTQNAFLGVMRNAYDQPLSLGDCVNRIMVFNALDDLGMSDGVLDLSHISRKLEVIIDAIVKEGDDTTELHNLFGKFFETLQDKQVPEFLLHRVPKSKREKFNITGFKSPMDVELDRIRDMAAQWDAFIEERRSYLVTQNWDSFKPNQIARSYYFPVNCEVAIEARRIKSAYNANFVELTKTYSVRPDGSKRDPMEARIKAYEDAQYRASLQISSHPRCHEIMLYLWQMVYGSSNPSDGILWGTDTANLMVEALYHAKMHPQTDEPERVEVVKEEEETPVPAAAAPPEPSNMQVTHPECAVTVVNGWAQKGLASDSPEVMRWKAQAGNLVLLSRTEVAGEEAIKVLIDDQGQLKRFGFVSKPDIARVKKQMGDSSDLIATLNPGSNLTMKAVIV